MEKDENKPKPLDKGYSAKQGFGCPMVLDGNHAGPFSACVALAYYFG